jgi:NAD(P)-dependent dehydrogenase (short-subunit alcohol dehydrogenase family)
MSDTILIFGARYLGRAVALHFAKQGARIAIAARTKADVEAAVKEIEAAGGKGLGIVADLTSREDARRAAQQTIEAFGGLQLAVNAVSPGGRFGVRPFLELEDSDLDLGLQISLKGAFRFLQEVGGILVKQGGGTLIQIGTSSSLRVKEGFGASGAVQHGLRALTIAAAKELRASKVHVAHLPCDGGIESGKTTNYAAKVGIDKLLPQEEIAKGVEYLYRQDPRAWTHELILRPFATDWTAPI